MKIERIETINLRYEYPEEKRFQGGAGICTGRVTSLILVHTDTGSIGIGSCYSHPALVYQIVESQLNPMLRGEDCTDIENLWAKMYNITRWYGRKGAAISALGGVDIALWDLKGKAAKQPLWRLLGGSQDCCPAYASGLLWNEIGELTQEAIRHIEDGYRRMKIRLARSEEYDRTAVAAVRRAIGTDYDLMADASMGYHLKLARRIGAFLEEQGVFWFEEPFTPEDIDSYAALRGSVDVPVAAGENEFGVQGFRELIRAEAVNIVQPDASRCGGITELRRIAQLAHEHGLGVAPHSWSDAVTVMANAHVVASISNGITVEIDRTGTPFIEELLVEPLSVADGMLKLSDSPGLGIELDFDMVNRLRMPDPLIVQDGAYSDMFFGKSFSFPSVPYVEIDA